jgi:hypothetical protein
MLVTTLGAFLVQIQGALARVDAATGGPDPNWVLAGIDAFLVLLALYVFGEAWTVFRRR